MNNENITMPQLVFTTREAAAALKVSQKTVYRLVARGLLHTTGRLRHLRITRSSLEKFVENND